MSESMENKKNIPDGELIRSLRCISTAGWNNPHRDCEHCPFYDREEDQKGNLECDVDEISMAAANRLEELVTEREKDNGAMRRVITGLLHEQRDNNGGTTK